MKSHFFHMLLYSIFVATFFAVLLRRDIRQQLKLGGYLWLGMVGGSLALAYLMYPFPR
jgi:hypothetical protein